MYPLRTCISCRRRARRDELLRIVLHGGRLTVDDRAVLPGRGAWVHPSPTCMKHAVTRALCARALKASGSLDASPLENRLETLMDK